MAVWMGVGRSGAALAVSEGEAAHQRAPKVGVMLMRLSWLHGTTPTRTTHHNTTNTTALP